MEEVRPHITVKMKQKPSLKAMPKIKSALLLAGLMGIVVLGIAMYSPSLSVAEYMEYVEHQDNGLLQQQENAFFTYSVQYEPLEYLALKELRSLEPSKEEVAQSIKTHEGLRYFILKIASKTGQDILKTNAASEEEYELRQYYFTSLLQNDLAWVSAAGDTLPPALCHFERNYGLAPHNNIVVAFPFDENTSAEGTFLFNDQVLGREVYSFSFEKSAIEQLPTLSLD